MKHNDDGRAAEEAVAEYLQSKDYKIIDTNWKTKWCEIDVVAEKDQCVYFVEVKYRASPDQGSGFDYITPSKLKQMQRAAESWVLMNRWPDEYVLSAAEVSGPTFKVEFIEQI